MKAIFNHYTEEFTYKITNQQDYNRAAKIENLLEQLDNLTQGIDTTLNTDFSLDDALPDALFQAIDIQSVLFAARKEYDEEKFNKLLRQNKNK